VAVVSDMLALSNQQSRERTEEWLPGTLVPPPARPHYLRFVVRDEPGILALIAAALARQEINVDALLQEPGYRKEALPFVVTVEPSEESALRAALDEITRAPFHAEPPLALPILGD
jgi:homoserine dehydrogenase